MHRLVIVGGGVAGIDLATHLEGRKLDRGKLTVTLIDREGAHVWKPMLHTIAAGTANVYLQQTSYFAQAHRHGFRYEPGEVVAVERSGKSVTVAPLIIGDKAIVPERQVPYDTLILAIGSVANDFGTPGVKENCYRIDSRTDAMAFNDAMRRAMIDAVMARTQLHVAIVGGGATGVEMAAEIVQSVEFIQAYGVTDATSRLKVTLIESGERLLAPFPPHISELAKVRLERLGVTVRLSERVTSADATGFSLGSGERIDAAMKVWAAGVRTPALTQRIDGLECAPSGQVIVTPTLQSTVDPSIFAVGDCGRLVVKGQDRPVPPTAQAAFQQALYLGRYLPRILAGGKVPDFKYRDFGSLVSLGGYDAYGSLGKFGIFKQRFIKGKMAQLGHLLLYRRHQARIHGFGHGSLLWLSDLVAAKVRPKVRLD